MKMDLSSKILLTIISLSVVVVIVSTAYKFLWLKDYNFIVEAACDPTSETCFFRDCSVPDDCPPNGLEDYKTFEVSAADFPKCSDNSCATECAAGTISCQEIICGEAEEDECTEPETQLEPQNSETSDLQTGEQHGPVEGVGEGPSLQ